MARRGGGADVLRPFGGRRAKLREALQVRRARMRRAEAGRLRIGEPGNSLNVDRSSLSQQNAKFVELADQVGDAVATGLFPDPP